MIQGILFKGEKVIIPKEKQNRKEILIPHAVPRCPWSKVGADLFESLSKYYLILVDYYSNLLRLSN